MGKEVGVFPHHTQLAVASAAALTECTTALWYGNIAHGPCAVEDADVRTASTWIGIGYGIVRDGAGSDPRWIWCRLTLVLREVAEISFNAVRTAARAGHCIGLCAVAIRTGRGSTSVGVSETKFVRIARRAGTTRASRDVAGDGTVR